MKNIDPEENTVSVRIFERTLDQLRSEKRRLRRMLGVPAKQAPTNADIIGKAVNLYLADQGIGTDTPKEPIAVWTKYRNRSWHEKLEFVLRTAHPRVASGLIENIDVFFRLVSQESDEPLEKVLDSISEADSLLFNSLRVGSSTDSTVTPEENRIRDLISEVFDGGQDIAIEFLSEEIEGAVNVIRKSPLLRAPLPGNGDAKGSHQTEPATRHVGSTRKKARRKAV